MARHVHLLLDFSSISLLQGIFVQDFGVDDKARHREESSTRLGKGRP